MRALGAAEILAVVESGDDQHPLDRALTLLLAATPEATRSTLAALSVAERDARLLRLRAATFGPMLHGFAACPACAERLEFTLDAHDLAALLADETIKDVSLAGRNLRLRLPDSRDLAEAASVPDPNTARRLLAERCIVEEQPAADLPDDVLSQIAERLAERAGAGDVRLDLSCPACETAWQSLFDISAFFWAELRTRAGRLLREVDTLARRYGWTEAVILSLSARRRQAYLTMAVSSPGEAVA